MTGERKAGWPFNQEPVHSAAVSPVYAAGNAGAAHIAPFRSGEPPLPSFHPLSTFIRQNVS